MVNHPLHYAKFIVAVIGAGVTAALGLVSPDTELFIWLTVLSAMLTAAGVYFVPNKQSPGNGRHRANA